MMMIYRERKAAPHLEEAALQQVIQLETNLRIHSFLVEPEDNVGMTKMVRMPYLAAQVAEVVIEVVLVALVGLVFLLETAGKATQIARLVSMALFLAVAAGDQKSKVQEMAVMVSAG